MRWLLIALWVFCTQSFAQQKPYPCGAHAPCAVDGGDYYLAFPAAWDGTAPLPAVLFFHGHNSSGAAVVKSAGLRRAFGERGYLLIAPNGLARPGRNVRGWPARPDFGGRRDDIAFVLALLDDIADKFPLDRAKILVSGFSSGGSMAWLLACYQGNQFAGFAPVAGALRRPTPDLQCPGGPARMLQIHGFTDKQVPLEGRGIRDWHQGDVFQSLALLRAANQCRSNPTRFAMGEQYRCRIWENCQSERDIRLCLHDGGHGLPKDWSTLALDWFERRD